MPGAGSNAARRGVLSGGSVPAPVISGAVVVGGSATLVSGVGPFTLYRGGVVDPVEVNRSQAQLEAYVYVFDDMGPTIQWAGPGGRLSNALQFDQPDLATVGASYELFGQLGTTLVSTDHVSAQSDQSGAGAASLTQTVDANRPRANRWFNGVPVNDYDGLNYWLGIAGPQIVDIFAAGTSFILACLLIDSNTTVADATTIFLGDTIWGSAANNLKLALYVAGGVKKVGYWQTTATLLGAQQTITDGAHIVRARKAGVTVGVRVDGGAEATAVADAASPTNQIMHTGWTGGSTRMLDGALGAILSWVATPSANVIATVEGFLSWTFATPQKAVIGSFKFMACGDSIVVGYLGLVGGWRPVADALCRNVGRSISFVGPYNDTGFHRGVSGDRLTFVAAALPTFAAELTTYVPDVVLLAWGANDIGNGVTVANALIALNSIIDQCRTSRPSCTVLVQTIILPLGGAYAAFAAQAVAFNAALPAVCAAKNCTLVDVGVIATSDGIHPTDTATGYPAQGAIIAPAIVTATM